MAGGKFDKLAGKVRPGTYLNFESTRQEALGLNPRGTVLLPLIGHDYGPEKEFISVYGDNPDEHIAKLGYSIYSDNASMLLIREALKNASTVIVYIPKQGAKARATVGALTATAKQGGKRGDDFSFSIVENPVGGFDVTVYLGADIASEHEGLSTIEALIAAGDAWLDFTGTGDLTATPGTRLAGGVTGTATNEDIAAFLDASEAIKWNAMSFPLAPAVETGGTVPALLEVVKSKIKYLRDDAGKYRVAVVTGLAADYEGISNVTNGVVLEDGTEISPAQATAFVAGICAGASITTSNTYAKYQGAVDIIGAKSHAESVAAINNGEFFFSFSEDGEVVVEYDINSLVTFAPPKDKSYRKNRVLRTLDGFGDAIKSDLAPNKFDGSPVGYDVMEGVGRARLKQFLDAGAIKNVDYDNDFVVDRGASEDDNVYITVGLHPVDSAEKLYVTVKTR